jgi:hypothetical protein
MLLDHEAALLRRPDRGFAARLCGLFEIPLLPVRGEVSQRHGKTPGVREAPQKHVLSEPKPATVVEASTVATNKINSLMLISGFRVTFRVTLRQNSKKKG